MKILIFLYLIVIVNLVNMSAFGAPGRRIYIGTQSNDIAAEGDNKKESVINTVDKKGIHKEESEETQGEMPESLIIKQSAENFSNAISPSTPNTGNSKQQTDGKVYILPHIGIPPGGVYKMKEVEQ